MTAPAPPIDCRQWRLRLETASILVQRARQAIGEGRIPRRNLLWLELTGCSGNIISLLDGDNDDLSVLSGELVNFVYENSLMVPQGQFAMEQLFSQLGEDYILAVEGAVATNAEGLYTVIGRWQEQPLTGLEAVRRFGEQAAEVIAVGTCASSGGISAAVPNPAACVELQAVLNRSVIRLPGCPCHPDWFMGTLAYILLYGRPPLDSQNRPLMFYSTLIHDLCPRRPDFDQGVFASHLGQSACMFKLGCRGPVTRVDCPIREWNMRVNWPIGNDSPCIGCAMFGFPDRTEPFVSYDIPQDQDGDMRRKE